MKLLFYLSLPFALCRVSAQQVPDSLYAPVIAAPLYEKGMGTRVIIDQAHHNFHTKSGRYLAFTKLLTRDGFAVQAGLSRFEKGVGPGKAILVISNAESDNVSEPVVRSTHSAFSKEEVKKVRQWVQEGGSLFLIADHMPFAGASSTLAAAFGFTFYDGFAMYTPKKGTIDFNVGDGSLTDHFISRGRNPDEKVNHVRSFTGQGFKIPDKAVPILRLNDSVRVFLTDTMWVFNDKVKSFPAGELYQGAVMKYGKGRVAVFGEAAMFSAQLAGPEQVKVGMNSQGAEGNHQLLLNIIHWLDAKLD